MNFFAIVAIVTVLVIQIFSTDPDPKRFVTAIRRPIEKAQTLSRDDSAHNYVYKLRRGLPIRVDNYMWIVGIRYESGKVFITQKRSEDIGPRRFALNVRYTHDATKLRVCATPSLRYFLNKGIAIQYYYVNPAGSLLAQEKFTPEDCQTRAMTARSFSN